MNVRRILLFCYFTLLLIFLYPRNFNIEKFSHSKPPKYSTIQVDTPFGSYASDRFKFDSLLLPYIDGYGRLIDVRYTDTPHQMKPFEAPEYIEHPLGFCLVLAKLQRGDYIPRKVIGVYSSDTVLSRPLSFDSLRFVDDISAMSLYWEKNTEYITEDLTAESLRANVDANNGSVVLLDNQHPVFVYDYDDSEFFVWDPVTVSDEFTIGASLSYHNGLLEFSGDKIVCLL